MPTETETGAWRDALTTGDEVVVRAQIGTKTRHTVHTVRVTPTQIQANGMRFRRRDGREIGREMYAQNTYEILPATDALRAQVATEQALRHAVRRCQQTRWESVPLATLTAIVDLLAKAGG